MNKAKLKAAIARSGENQEKLSEALDMAVSALNARINGHVDFRCSEIETIVHRYKLSPEETTEIFFDSEASKQDAQGGSNGQ